MSLLTIFWRNLQMLLILTYIDMYKAHIIIFFFKLKKKKKMQLKNVKYTLKENVFNSKLFYLNWIQANTATTCVGLGGRWSQEGKSILIQFFLKTIFILILIASIRQAHIYLSSLVVKTYTFWNSLYLAVFILIVPITNKRETFISE